MQKKVYEIDGMNFSSLDEFYDEISDVLIPGAGWGRNLDAFNDILRGGFGTPDEGYVLLWKNSELSRDRLGYTQTVRQLEKRLTRCHRDSIECVERELEQAKQEVGSTVFDWLIKIIEVHCTSGEEQEDGVELILA